MSDETPKSVDVQAVEPVKLEVALPPKALPPPTTKCPDGPGNEHEWEVSEEINVLICLHCTARAESAQVVLLYQKARVADKKAVADITARLNHELKRKDTYVPDLKDCKTEMERQLFQDCEYFQKRLDEEISLSAEMKKNVAGANRRVDEMALKLKNTEAANATVKRARDAWKEGYEGLKTELQALIKKVVEEGP